MMEDFIGVMEEEGAVGGAAMFPYLLTTTTTTTTTITTVVTQTETPTTTELQVVPTLYPAFWGWCLTLYGIYP